MRSTARSNDDDRDRRVSVLASIGLAVGGILGMAGTFAPTAALRGLAWGIDGIALIMASALLTLMFFRKGEDVVAAGFMVFAIGESLVVATAAMDLAAAVPMFGVGTGIWAMALALISAPRVFPLPVRLLGLVAAALFGVTALRILAGVQLLPTTSPLPFNAYPFLVATMVGWIWTLLRVDMR
jgi:hypothetical protein